MTNALAAKHEGNENFPVASWLVRREHRAPMLTFYRFARAADDIADDPDLSADEKLVRLEAMRATLIGESDADRPALALRDTLAARRMDTRHPLDLLAAFRRDVSNPRVADWDDLIDYCRLSAMPVGRFVLDVHGEDRATWAASDALCAALQVVNHLQDCGEDWRDLRRVYVPADELAAAGVDVAALGEAQCSAGLRAIVSRILARTEALLAESAGFARQIVDARLACEVAVIHRLATGLCARLKVQDPLAMRVRHSRPETVGLSLLAVAGTLIGRVR